MRLAPTRCAWLTIPLLTACSQDTTPGPSFPAPIHSISSNTLLDSTGLARLTTDTTPQPELGQASSYQGYTVQPLSFEVYPGFRSSAALWRPEGEGPFPGVLVLPGHFGEGKASGECQEVAHGLAARGIAALAVDMPGVEEWEVPGRQLHFDAGAHNRAVLAAAGTSALGLQIRVAQRGLDALLEVAPIDRVAATGASGGGVLAFYLALVDPRVRAVALASPVGIPRDGTSGGCFCDLLHGHAGPQPALLSALESPSLWLSELDQAAPAGLPASARWEVVQGPHSYTAAMRAIALPWLDHQLGHQPRDTAAAEQAIRQPAHTPGQALRSPVDHGAMSILELALAVGGPRDWQARTDLEQSATHSCAGDGDAIIAVGAGPEDLQALRAVGWAPCDLHLVPDETWEPRAFTAGYALVDRPAAALRQLSAELGGAPIYGTGPWAIAAAASGAPWVGRTPLHSLDQVDPVAHPAWVHVPGGWWGGLEELYGHALAMGDDPNALIEALEAARPSAAAPSAPPARPTIQGPAAP
jgi:dienelactone hydrolase